MSIRVNRRRFMGYSLTSTASLLAARQLVAQQLALDWGIKAVSDEEIQAMLPPGAQADLATLNSKPIPCKPCVDFDLTPNQLSALYREAIKIPSNKMGIEADLDERPEAVGAQADMSLGHLRQEGIIQRNLRWQQGATLTYRFLTRNTLNVIKDACVQAMEEWAKLTGLTFRESNGTVDIKISFAPGRGHYSLIGIASKMASRESLNIDPNGVASVDDFIRVARHEFGHAVGFVHEQFHFRDPIDWVKPIVFAYFAKLGWGTEKVIRNVFQRVNEQEYATTRERDPESIMHYWFPRHFHHNGASVPDEPNERMSLKDQSFARTQFNHPGPPDIYSGHRNPEKPDVTNLKDDVLPIGETGLSGTISNPGDRIRYEIKTPEADQVATYIIETFEDAPSIAMKLSLYDAKDLSGNAIASGMFNGRRLLNARIEAPLQPAGTYYVVAEHFHKTASSTGTFKIRAVRKP